MPAIAVSRRPPQASTPSVTWLEADVTRPGAIAGLPNCRAVVSTLAIWLTADVLPELIRNGATRLVAFSSSSAETKADAADAGERALSERLVRHELELLACGPQVAVTLLRPSMIYGGPGDANVERIAGHIARFGVFPVVGRGSGLRQPVHVHDLGEAVVQALWEPATSGKVYTVAGDERLSVAELVQRVAAAQGRRVHLVRVPLRSTEWLLRQLSRVPGFRSVPAGALKRLNQDLVFDCTPAMQDFGYSPRAFQPPRYPRS